MVDSMLILTSGMETDLHTEELSEELATRTPTTSTETHTADMTAPLLPMDTDWDTFRTYTKVTVSPILEITVFLLVVEDTLDMLRKEDTPSCMENTESMPQGSVR